MRDFGIRSAGGDRGGGGAGPAPRRHAGGDHRPSVLPGPAKAEGAESGQLHYDDGVSRGPAPGDGDRYGPSTEQGEPDGAEEVQQGQIGIHRGGPDPPDSRLEH